MSTLAKTMYDEVEATSKLVNELINIIDENTVIVCIGTDKCIGDALGPLVGSMLKQNKSFTNKVYGTLEHPIHALNIPAVIPRLKERYSDCTILAIDAAISSTNPIGTIRLKDTPIKPGAGAGKDLEYIGDYSIVGIVDVSESPAFILNNIRLHFIMEMAQTISNAIITAVELNRKTVKENSYKIGGKNYA